MTMAPSTGVPEIGNANRLIAVRGVADYLSLVQCPQWPFPISPEAREQLDRFSIETLAVSIVAGFTNGVADLLTWGRGWKQQSSMLLPADVMKAYPCIYTD